MIGRSWLHRALLSAVFLLACSQDSPVGSSEGGGSGNGGGNPTLNPATFKASVNPTIPPGYSIFGEMPYQWQAYFYADGAWVAVGHPQLTEDPSTLLVIDCNDPAIQDACTIHRSAMIQVTIRNVSPGPALLCGYKSGFRFYDDFLLSTPVGTLSVAPVASSSQDPMNQGTCFP
ncbi:MAG: hypothetical protein R2910_13420 [Gemmatimonadales bacterium]